MKNAGLVSVKSPTTCWWISKRNPLQVQIQRAGGNGRSPGFFAARNHSKPVIFIGAGTCGLGAGAAKTLEAIKSFLANRHTDADVIEVGCNGMCSDEPIVDIQIPGYARVSFGPVTADKVDALLESVFFPKSHSRGTWFWASIP